MSTAFSGTLFDGETLAARPVHLEAIAGHLHGQGGGVEFQVPLAEVRVSDRLASLPRFLYLPDSRTIETPDNDAIDALLAGQRRGRTVALVHWLETQAKVAAAATLLLVVSVGIAIAWGLPIAARRLAMAVPPSIERQAGRSALLTLSRLLPASRLTIKEHVRVGTQLGRLLRARPGLPQPELVFRSMGGKSPNAFALPGGIIVVSDELIGMANDEELAAVLAHEIGHWQLRHGLQGVLRSSAALLVVSTVTGDLSTLTTFAGTIPFTLLQRGYSREFEAEADAYAVELLKSAQIDVAHFASILKKLEAARPSEGQDLTYLSTHPATTDRITRINPDGHLPPGRESPPVEALTPMDTAKLLNAFTKPVVTERYDLKEVDTVPQPRLQTPPVYPAHLAKEGISGSVVVEFIIDAEGDVVDTRVVRSTRKEFEADAVAAVLKWKFVPARKGDRNVATRVSQLIEFNLEDVPSGSDPSVPKIPPP